MSQGIRFAPAVLVAFVGALVAPSCGDRALAPAGAVCSSDGDCAAGLACLGVARLSDAGCARLAQLCSKACRSDRDCVAVGEKFQCFADCDGTSTCAPIP